MIAVSVPASLVPASAGENGQPLLRFVSKQGVSPSLENTTLSQGESAVVHVVATVSQGYEIVAVNLQVDSIPPNIYAWIVWNQFPMFDSERNPVTDYQLKVYADSNAATGEYVLKISGTGVAKNLATSEDVQIMNETLGSLHLTILPFNSTIKMDVGEPEVQTEELCIEDDSSPGGGTMCAGFVAKEEFPISVSGATGTHDTISLSASGVPEGVWAKFVPAELTLDDNGNASGKLVLAGAVRPFVGFPPDTQPMEIHASGENDSTISVNYLPIVKTGDLTILQSAGAIAFPAEIINNVNGTNFAYYGAVYDPIDDERVASHENPESLHVTLSVAGITQADDTTEISPLPSWLMVDIPVSSFTLNASEPYYFVIKTTTSSAPAGDYAIAIDEVVRDERDAQKTKKLFREYAPLTVGPPVRLGPASSGLADNDDVVSGNASTDGRQPPLASSPDYKLSWSREVKGTFTTVDISDDKSYLGLGSGSGDKEGAVYVYDSKNGNLLWNYNTDRRISSVKISSDGSRIAATGIQFSEGPGKAYVNGAIYYFDARTGQLLWSKTTGSEPVMFFSMSSDGSHLVVGTNQNVLYYDSEGNLLWNETLGSSLDGITASSDGSFVFAVASSIGQPGNPNEEWGGFLIDGKSGEVLWDYRGTEAPTAQAPAMSDDGKYVAVGAALSGYNGFVYYFDREGGELLWKRQINSPALATSLSSDGSALAVSTNWALLFFDGKTGNLLWNNTASDASAPNASQLKMTPDGRYIVGGVWGGGTGKDIQLLDSKGDLLWTYPSGTVYSVNISDDGSMIAASASSAFRGDWQSSPTTVYLFQRQNNVGTLDSAADNLNRLVADGGTMSFMLLIGLAAAGSIAAAVVILRRPKK